MKNYPLIIIFFMTISTLVLIDIPILQAGEKAEKKQDELTQEQAEILASKIANEKFQKYFNLSPFTPESYTAQLVDNKWCWGKISPAGINGCSAKVTFNRDGSEKTVKVAYHTDILIKDTQTRKAPIENEKVIPGDNFRDLEEATPDKDRPETR